MSDRTKGMEGVDRALRVLDALSARGSGMTLSEVAAAAGIPKSSLHRTLAALRRRGFAAQHADGRYLLGPDLLRIAFDFHDRMDVRVLVRPALDSLRSEVNETIHLGVLDGSDVVYVDKLEPSGPIALTSKIGGRNPAHATAVGKALLAWTYPTKEALAEWIARSAPLNPRTPRTIVEEGALDREIRQVRSAGFARDMEESEIGIRCLAVPVFFGGPTPVAAISISAPKERLPASRLKDVAQILRRASASVGTAVDRVGADA
ncbi:MAG: IclR family transcriptional regulator [Actinomycetota bacterium]